LKILDLTIQKSKGEVPFPLYAVSQNSPAVEHQHTLEDNMHDVMRQALTYIKVGCPV